MSKKHIIVNLIIQKLKNKHISLKKYYKLSNPRSCDSEFRILISVQKMCPLGAPKSLLSVALRLPLKDSSEGLERKF